jgi:hypothetical protein
VSRGADCVGLVTAYGRVGVWAYRMSANLGSRMGPMGLTRLMGSAWGPDESVGSPLMVLLSLRAFAFINCPQVD